MYESSNSEQSSCSGFCKTETETGKPFRAPVQIIDPQRSTEFMQGQASTGLGGVDTIITYRL